MAKNKLSVNKTFAVFGLAAGLLIIAAIIATMPSPGRLEAHEQLDHGGCRTEQVQLDQGYGVSRVAEHRVCDDL